MRCAWQPVHRAFARGDKDISRAGGVEARARTAGVLPTSSESAASAAGILFFHSTPSSSDTFAPSDFLAGKREGVPAGWSRGDVDSAAFAAFSDSAPPKSAFADRTSSKTLRNGPGGGSSKETSESSRDIPYPARAETVSIKQRNSKSL